VKQRDQIFNKQFPVEQQKSTDAPFFSIIASLTIGFMWDAK